MKTYLRLLIDFIRHPRTSLRQLQGVLFAYRDLRRELGALQQQVTELYLDEHPPEHYRTRFESAPGVFSDHFPELSQYLRESAGREDPSEALYHAFQLVLRGHEQLIADRQRHYLSTVALYQRANAGLPVLDVGCGRGEFLGLLRQQQLPSRGVDTSRAEVQRLRSQGFEVFHADANPYLQSLPERSLAGITAFQVIEHLSHDALKELLSLGFSRLAPGGFILLETVNPYCLDTFRTYYLDPTHRSPVPIDLLAIMMQFYGYEGLEAFYENPVVVRKVDSQLDPRRYYENYALLGLKKAGGP